ncbi:fibronectin type III domain-containing protein [Psychrobacillus sp. OK032]|uniref:fibronectin type III domain-containing protein n=1 Tax=Psychrobacillus sp. OK032 TaxID=1884358 RepID=UPI0008AE5101|nr:fibronectin type III domain-containing protein [Psychrobacillus sp. OK032]SES45507.1 Purple acid Phosphatase, N-terminal domain [Psychrobacillus sp. OK032]
MMNYLTSKAKRKVLSVLAASALLVPVTFSTIGDNVQAAQIKDVAVTYDVSDFAFSLGSDESQRTFNWYTDKTDQAGVVQFAKANNGYGQKFPKGKTVTVEATLEDATSGESSHEATITGLKENTTYNYRFGDGEGKWSESYTFTVREAEAVDGQTTVTGDVKFTNSVFNASIAQEITLDDDDLNLSSTALETVVVTVTDGNVTANVTLTEDEVDEGTFTGELSLAQLAAFADHKGNPYGIERTLTVTYNDAADVNGDAVIDKDEATLDTAVPGINVAEDFYLATDGFTAKFLEVGATVTVYQNGTSVTSEVVDANGAVTITGLPIDTKYEVTISDAAGNESEAFLIWLW